MNEYIPECVNVCVATFGIVVTQAAGVTGKTEASLHLFWREAQLGKPEIL